MSWSQAIQISGGRSPSGLTSSLGQTYVPSMGVYQTADPAGMGLTSTSATTSLHRSQVQTTSNFRPLRDPDHYEKIDQIGKGAYGTVFKARDRSTGTIVALKTMRFALTEDGVPMAILREISLLKQLEKFEHPNIVRLLDITHGQRRDREMSLHLIFEHLHQDLASYIEKCPPPGLSSDRIKTMMFQILNGVDFLHSHRIVHRDLKPQNLLVTRDGNVKLTDFGLARIYDFYTLLTSVVVTLWYRAPEVLMGVSYATPVDIWACGCIFAELYTRRALFPGQYEMDQLNKIFDIIGVPSQEEWPQNAAVLRTNFQTSRINRINFGEIIPELDTEAKDLLEKMLCFDPSQRITASEALAHPYFDDLGLNRVTQTSQMTSLTNTRVESPSASTTATRLTPTTPNLYANHEPDSTSPLRQTPTSRSALIH